MATQSASAADYVLLPVAFDLGESTTGFFLIFVELDRVYINNLHNSVALPL
ncbi:hypothetical protein ACFL0S_11450 [Thermodesulfobacteriota bacterium]